jgi:hypothetical protein
MTRHDSESSDRIDASTSRTGGDAGGTAAGGALSRRRLLGAVGAGAAAGLAGCSGILGGGGGGDDGSSGDSDGGSGGGGSDNVQNEVDGIEITGTSGQATQDTYAITVNLENTGDGQPSVLDFDYRVTLYDDSGSEIPTQGSVAINQDGFFNGDTGTVEIQPRIEADPSTVASYELRVLCDEGPYCQ